MKNKDLGSILQTVLSIVRYVLLILLLWKLYSMRYNLETPEESSPDFRNEIKFMMDKNEAALTDFNSNINISESTKQQRDIILRMEVQVLKNNFCKYVKPRYVCFGDRYDEWLSRAQLPSDPSSVQFQEFDSFKNLKIAFVGNSHLREIFESLICPLQGQFDEIQLDKGTDSFSIFKSSNLNVTICSFLNHGKWWGKFNDGEWVEMTRKLGNLEFNDFDFIVMGKFNSRNEKSFIKKISSFPGIFILTWDFLKQMDEEVIESAKAENLNVEVLDVNKGIKDFGLCGADYVTPLGTCDDDLTQAGHQCLPGPPTVAVQELLKIIKIYSK